MSATNTPPDTASKNPPRSRWRYWLQRAGWGSLSAIVLVGALLIWLLNTVGGRDALLARVVSALPPGSLSWERAEGVINGPLTLYGVHYAYQGVDFRARRVQLDAALRPLLGRRLRLESLAVDDAALDLPIKPQPLPSWPGSLPKFAMPFDLSADGVRVRGLRISRGHQPVIAITRLDGGLDLAPGRFAARALTFDSDRGHASLDGGIDVARNYQVRLLAQLTLPPPASGTAPATLRLLAGGDMDRFVTSVSGNAPGPLALRLDLRNGRAIPQWALAVQAPRLDPNLLLGGDPMPQPYAIVLNLIGNGGSARAQGRIARGENGVEISPSQLGYEHGVLSAQPLVLHVLDGELRLAGRADLRPKAPVLDVRATLQGLRWQGFVPAADVPRLAVKADGELDIKGTLDAWSVQGALDLARAKNAAHVTLAGRGDRAQIRFDTLQARTPAGALDATGLLRWTPMLAWQLDATLERFDPGYFAPGFDGAVSGHLLTRGERDPAGALIASAALDTLSGQLRGRRLGGRVALEWSDDAAGGVGHTDADLNLGASHVIAKGAFGRSLDLAVRLAPLRLDDVWPTAAGSLVGALTLRGDASAPSIAGALAGQSLRWGGYAAQSLHLDGRLPARGTDGALALTAQGIVGLYGVDALNLRLSGSFAAPHVSGDASGDLGHLVLSGEAQQQGNTWRGRIDTLHYAPPRGAAWTLAAPATFRFGNAGLALDHACLDAIGSGRVCADADWPRSANISGRGLPLALVEPWLQRPDFAPHAVGSVEIDAHLAAARGGGWSGQARLHSAQGSLRLGTSETGQQNTRDLLGYSNLAVDVAFVGERVQLRVDSGLSAGGTLKAQATTGLTADAPLAGSVDLDLHDITWLELFSTDLAGPKGHAVAHLALAGTRAHPQVSGQGSVSDFEGELPALGLNLTQGKLQLTAAANGDTQVNGSVRSGDGTLAIDGRLRWSDPAAPMLINLHGQNVRISNTPDLVATADPDLQLAYSDGVLKLRGKVDVPSAEIDLEKLDNTVSPSPDVVVLDPRGVDPNEPARHGVLSIDTDLVLALGADVKLKGFGLDGKVGGQLRVRQPPGRELLATGNLDVSGRYRAYGQQLQIERGRLGYVNSAIDNPNLDVLAQHEFDQATVGVRVRGTALAPQTQIVSTPAMDSSEALAYLVLGHPLRSASNAEGRQVGAAALALSAGSNLIAQKVGARLGLDEAGVSQSRALGSAAFTVGKYLSPRLFISYGVSLVGTGEVLTLKYLLKHGLDIQIESGRENRASLNWRKEK